MTRPTHEQHAKWALEEPATGGQTHALLALYRLLDERLPQSAPANAVEEALHAPAPGYPDGIAAAYPNPATETIHLPSAPLRVDDVDGDGATLRGFDGHVIGRMLMPHGTAITLRQQLAAGARLPEALSQLEQARREATAAQQRVEQYVQERDAAVGELRDVVNALRSLADDIEPRR